MNNEQLMLGRPEWAALVMQQLCKDAALSGFEWTQKDRPETYRQWVDMLYEELSRMDKHNPEQLRSFLYRVDLPENIPRTLSESLAEAVLKRIFLKVWIRSQYRP